MAGFVQFELETDADQVCVRERIAALRAQVMDRHGSLAGDLHPYTLDVALWRAWQPGRSRVQLRAALLREVVELARLDLHPDWTLAGEHLLITWQGQGLRHLSFGHPDPSEPQALARLRELGVAPDQAPGVVEAVRRWEAGPGRDTPPVAVGEVDPDHNRGRSGAWNGEFNTVYSASGWIENHSIRDYAKVLRKGFAGILQEVEDRLAGAELADPDYPRQENFWRAARSICQAGIRLGQRYAELAAQRAAQTADPEEQVRLERMAGTCARVPAQGARTFFEATQALWLAHVLTCGEDGINANSIGRLDQILYPWYQADLEKGRLSRDEAVELMAELACKLYLDYDVQAITLGGLDREGRDAVNDLSYVILEATRSVEFVRDLSVRLHRRSPPAFVDLAASLIARGGGIPFLFNDDCFVKALHERGIALEDARNYAPIGCIELTVPGRANPHAVSGWFNSTKCLELALFDGEDPRTGTRLGPPTGRLADFAGFADLYEAYCRQVDFFARRMVYHCNRGELAQREGGPLPCWSTLTDDCIARGRDITDGGAVYNYHSICFLGTANTADSMMAVKRLVFEERQVDPETLLAALRCDFAGDETLRQLLLRGAPKYGNDQAEVDELACRVDTHFIDLMDQQRSPLGGRFFVHLFSFLANIGFGKAVGATPDGRRAGEPLAYSLSAHQGRDEKGVTAMIHSLARLPHDQAAGATAAILEVDPDLVEGESGVQLLSLLIQTAIAMGVGQLQWNVTTVERLKKAQEDPERYGNIAVRVAGYSQMFRLIDRELQDHIIARTKHRR